MDRTEQRARTRRITQVISSRDGLIERIRIDLSKGVGCGLSFAEPGRRKRLQKLGDCWARVFAELRYGFYRFLLKAVGVRKRFLERWDYALRVCCDIAERDRCLPHQECIGIGHALKKDASSRCLVADEEAFVAKGFGGFDPMREVCVGEGFLDNWEGGVTDTYKRVNGSPGAGGRTWIAIVHHLLESGDGWGGSGSQRAKSKHGRCGAIFLGVFGYPFANGIHYEKGWHALKRVNHPLVRLCFLVSKPFQKVWEGIGADLLYRHFGFVVCGFVGNVADPLAIAKDPETEGMAMIAGFGAPGGGEPDDSSQQQRCGRQFDRSPTMHGGNLT
jgi:hypothetical protein